MEKLISTKNRIFSSLVRPSNSGKTYLIYEWLKVGTFQRQVGKIFLFLSALQPLYDNMQNEIGNLEFVQAVKFEFINSFKNKGPNICSNNGTFSPHAEFSL